MNQKLLVFLVLTAAASGLAFLGLEEGRIIDSQQDRPNIILIDIDRLNSDRMPCYGYHRNTTPNLCRFGRNNLFFKQSVSQAGWTAGSIASVFTSQYTGVHGVEGHGDTLSPDHFTMAEILNSKGYRTAAFPALPDRSPSFLHRGYNLDQGFDSYVNGSFTLDRSYSKFAEWENNTEEPYFAFIQGFGPHRYVNLNPPIEKHYRKQEMPEEFTTALENNYSVGTTDIVMENGDYYLRRRNGELIGLEEDDMRYVHNQYDDALKTSDRAFGRVIRDLKKKGVYSDSIVIVFANHGEMLDTRTFAGIDRRFGHGQIWDSDIQTFLMVHLPEGKDRTIEKQVQLIDILPTVLQEVGIEVNKTVRQGIQGESLTPLYTRSEGSYSSRYAFATRYSAASTAIRNSTWKFVENTFRNDALYNLQRDPDENNNVIEKYPRVAEALISELEKHQIRNQKLRAQIEDEDGRTTTG